MEICESGCKQLNSSTVKINFIDRLFGRSIHEKMSNHCHVSCIKNLKIPNVKRNGRWGFIQILGFTEIFSSLIALMSCFMNIYCFRKMILPKLKKSPMGHMYLIQHHICNAAFISSFLFHARETTLTRNADYFSAVASILIGLLVPINRLVLFHYPSSFKEFNTLSLRCSLFYFVFHIAKMTSGEFDYSYNKISCATIFCLSLIFNLMVILNYRNTKHSRQMLYSIGCLLLAGGIEILDISPIFYLFDSHAMWHLLMAVAAPFYFKFITNDLDYQVTKTD